MFGFSKKPEVCFWEAILSGDVNKVRELVQATPDLSGTRAPHKLCRRDSSLTEDIAPLHVAAVRGQTQILKLLLLAGAEVDVTTDEDRTPLHEAATADQIEAIDLLLYRQADIDARDSRQRTPLHLAGLAGHDRAVKLLLSRGAGIDLLDIEGNTVLHCLAAGGCEQGVLRALQGGASVDACNEVKRRTPLHLAVVHADHSAYSRVEPDRRSERARMERVAQLLIEYGADVNAVDSGENTPLDLFNYLQGDDESDPLVKLLLKHGGRWNRYHHRHTETEARTATAAPSSGVRTTNGTPSPGRQPAHAITAHHHESHGSTMGSPAVARSVHGFVGEPTPLNNGDVIIGRNPDCHIRFQSRTLSRRHAQVTFEHGSYMIRDLGSRNGVKINGRPIHAAHLLSPGEIITLGVYEFEFDGKNLIPLREELSEAELRAEGSL